MIEKVDIYTLMGEFNNLDAGYGYLGDYYFGYVVISRTRNYQCDFIMKAKSNVPDQKFLIKMCITITNSRPYTIRLEHSRRILDYQYISELSLDNTDVYKITSDCEIDQIVKRYVDNWDMMDTLKL